MIFFFKNRFTEWAKMLGDIYSIQMGQQNWIILTGDKVVGDLLQKRGGKYSSRTPSYYFYQILTRNRGFISSPYNERYKMLLPIMLEMLSQRAVKEQSDLIDSQFHILMQNFYRASTNIKDSLYPKYYFQLASLNIITTLCSAKSIKDIEDPFYKEFEISQNDLIDLVKITNNLSDFFPILGWFSNDKIYRRVIETRRMDETFYGKMIEDVKNVSEGKPCFIKNLLHKMDEGILDELDIVHILGALFGAGTDTVSSSLTWITAALANNPEVQYKAHQELDKIIGHSRLPSASDEPNLHYIRAIIKEGQRYCGPIYLGVPHYIEEDDEYNGYHIPANSVVILNQYGIHMDEKRYENPKEFKPERFFGITESSAVLANGNYQNRDHFGFGAGRRLCTGIHLAELELFLGVSRLLWCFKIENASPLSKDGKPMPIDLEKVRFGITVWPEKYHIKFIKRHENVEKVLFG
ncbi:cytochrome P450 [Gigaspora rosea]|uniref:Cytochrome P450 n=1 Tax=Gigaspora rosea TaxID=44941 RepID=A0A397VVG1_9GLOM|nr:cytochrome P450 [Gigaspora rosea]